MRNQIIRWLTSEDKLDILVMWFAVGLLLFAIII